MAKSSPETSTDDWKWKVENAADTLVRAEEIRTDSRLFAAAQKKLKQQQKAVKRALSLSKGLAAMSKGD